MPRIVCRRARQRSSSHSGNSSAPGGRSGPAVSDPKWKGQLYGFDNTFAFGEFTFDTSKADPEVTFQLVKHDGKSLYEITLKRSELTPS